MRRIRFHLGTLVILVLLVGVGLAALRESNENWDSGIFSLTLAVLLISVLLAIHRTEHRRAFWLGFALFGWAYLELSLVPSIESRLITTKGLAFVDSKVPVDAFVVTDQVGQGVTGTQKEHTVAAPFQRLIVKKRNQDGISPVYYNRAAKYMAYKTKLRGSGSGKTENFVRIGHSLMALLTAWFGGQFSRYFCTTKRNGNIGTETSAAVDLG
jgi:hypothetical protein